jgi:threonine/homoserine/homoserine lactone efflux protein
MSLTALLMFGAAYAVATASPGPGIAALLARVLGRGLKGAPAFIAGFVVGDLLWFAIAAASLAVLINTFAVLFLAIKYAGVAYLVYLAFRLWTAPAEPAAPAPDARSESRWRLFLGGLSITLGNPKVILFFGALLPHLVDLERITVVGILQIALLIVVILGSVLTAYALAAAGARRLFTTPRAIKIVNRGTGAVMAGAAGAIAAQ